MEFYAELQCRSYYSFLEGASDPEDLAIKAAEKGLKALALTDRNGLYGAIPFAKACQEQGVKPIIGAQLSIDGVDEIIVLCRDQEGYRRLSHCLSKAYEGREKGDPYLAKEQLAMLGEHVIVILGHKDGLPLDDKLVASYEALFSKEQIYIGLCHHEEEGDAARCRRLARLAAERQLPLVISNAPAYAEAEDYQLHDVLLCIKERCTLDESHPIRSGNNQRYLKSGRDLPDILRDYSEAWENTRRIAEECNVSLDFSCYRFPEYPVPEGHSSQSYLTQLCLEALPSKYSDLEQPRKQLLDELALVGKLGLSGYFLLVWDIVQFARKKQIPVQGRGSAANSLVAYVLGITPVDPIANKLYLGRFINEQMTATPDIDLDFASQRHPDYPDREDVIRYVYERYGREHVAMVCTFITFKLRSAIREVGRVLKMPEKLLGQMCKVSGYRYGSMPLDDLADVKEFRDQLSSEAWALFRDLVNRIIHVPRHISIHVGGMLIASCPLADLVPLEPARMEGRIVCQWDKDMVEDAGLIKVDILGLGMLAVLRETVDIIGEPIDLNALTPDDPQVYEMLGKADTVGVFQVESRAQMQSLPRTRPSNFHELGVQVAIIRPGPLQGDMVAPYIRRKQGKEPVTYLHPSLEGVLGETLGVILFQEQVLQAAAIIAGFSPGQAEGLRRAMSRKRSRLAMEQIRQQFMEGAEKNAVDPDSAQRVFSALEGFALYGFCKSHALAFARIAYVSAWLKHYHHAAFTAALLNNQPMGFYPNESLIADAKNHGVEILGVDMQLSQARCAAKGQLLRLGFSLVKGVSTELAQEIVTERKNYGPFHSLRDFLQRLPQAGKCLENLIQAGAWDFLGLQRRELLWQLWLLGSCDLKTAQLFEPILHTPDLAQADPWTLLMEEFRVMGLSPDRHPMEFFRRRLDRDGVLRSSDLQERCHHKQHVRVAGMVVCRQRPPTAKGFAFLTMEDEYGMMNVIIPPRLYEAERYLIRQEPLLLFDGVLQIIDNVVNIRAIRIQNISRPCKHS